MLACVWAALPSHHARLLEQAPDGGTGEGETGCLGPGSGRQARRVRFGRLLLAAAAAALLLPTARGCASSPSLHRPGCQAQLNYSSVFMPPQAKLLWTLNGAGRTGEAGGLAMPRAELPAAQRIRALHRHAPPPPAALPPQ